MTQKTKKVTMIDLSASVGLDSLISQLKKLGQVEIVGFKKHTSDNPFRSDTSGQTGQYEYIIQLSDDKTISTGADDCIKMVRGIGADGPVISDDILSDFMASRHFSVLKQANSRH